MSEVQHNQSCDEVQQYNSTTCLLFHCTRVCPESDLSMIVLLIFIRLLHQSSRKMMLDVGGGNNVFGLITCRVSVWRIVSDTREQEYLGIFLVLTR